MTYNKKYPKNAIFFCNLPQFCHDFLQKKLQIFTIFLQKKSGYIYTICNFPYQNAITGIKNITVNTKKCAKLWKVITNW